MPEEILYVKVAFCAPADVTEELEIAREIVDEWNVNNGEKCKLLVKLLNWKSDARPGLGRPQEIINHDIVAPSITFSLLRHFFHPSLLFMRTFLPQRNANSTETGVYRLFLSEM
jgi:hypothetical protein